MHLGLPFQGAVVQGDMPLEDVFQNKVVCMFFSVDTKYQFQAASKARRIWFTSWTAISYYVYL